MHLVASNSKILHLLSREYQILCCLGKECNRDSRNVETCLRQLHIVANLAQLPPQTSSQAKPVEIYLHWLDLATDEACPSAAMPEWMTTTCSNAQDSKNTRLTTSTVGTGKLGVKWSRSQARALDK
ncbi:hypothetical protein TNCV_308441 [Trichonephila clavipes]|nr:hypothetical protein TNCV_308441 [Trichonephila clavipes]